MGGRRKKSLHSVSHGVILSPAIVICAKMAAGTRYKAVKGPFDVGCHDFVLWFHQTCVKVSSVTVTLRLVEHMLKPFFTSLAKFYLATPLRFENL